jgi:hypothetical protein
MSTYQGRLALAGRSISGAVTEAAAAEGKGAGSGELLPPALPDWEELASSEGDGVTLLGCALLYLAVYLAYAGHKIVRRMCVCCVLHARARPGGGG